MDSEYNVKITKVLKKLLDPDFKVKNDVYLNSLLTNLIGGTEGKHNVDCTISKQQLPGWLTEGISQWEKSKRIPSSSVLSFTLNLAGSICKDEQTFVMLNSQNVYERLIKLIGVDDPTVSPTIKLGYIRLVSALLEHKSGLQWIISTNYWADVMRLTLKNQTIYITKEGYKFLAGLLDKSVKINEMFCFNVVQLMMAPINESAPCMPQNNVINILEIRDQAIYQTLCSSLTLITEVLEIFLEDIKRGNDLKVVLMFIEKFNLEQQIRNVLLIAQNECFVYDLYKILFLLSFFDLYRKFGGKGEFIEYEKAAQPGSKLYDVLTENVSKGLIRNVIKLTYIGFVYWDHISTKMPICIKYGDSLPGLFEHQMLMLQLYPIICVSFQLLGEKAAMKLLDEDEVRDYYVDKVCKNITVDTMRIFYQWRNDLIVQPYIFDHATLSLSYLIKSKKFFTRELGVTSFQTLIYCLRDVINVLKEQPEQLLTLSKEHNYMTLVIEAVSVFINEFNVNWRDSLESICVMNLAFDFLSLPTWSTKLVVKGLKLVDVAISKYMAPNMALLIDNINDSTMAVIGPMLYAKLHDGNWEVRDTALEVLCTISNNAKETGRLDQISWPVYRGRILKPIRACGRYVDEVGEPAHSLYSVFRLPCDREPGFITVTKGEFLKWQILPPHRTADFMDMVLCVMICEHLFITQFPSFSRIVLEAELPSLILKMAINDGEAFVRATAVRCLHEMVQVPEFWEDLLKCGNVHEQIIQILQRETEGIVRSQAATLIAAIYEHHGIPPEKLCEFFDIMTHAATADLHWEVKVNALAFWEKVINSHLTHQGMIDGMFPKVTFSREHRKIVTLNEPEVRKRLVKVLNQLSETGCLAVLIAALKDDCDIEVNKAATKITENFVKMLKTYHIDDSNANLSNPPSPLTPISQAPSPMSQKIPSVSSDSQYHSMSPLSQFSQQGSVCNSPSVCHFDEMADSILEDIINSQDINLLKGVFNAADQPLTSYPPMALRQTVMPSDFLKFTYTDLETHVNKKTKWLNGMDDFGSLLDDILKEYENVSNNVNSMDCY